MKKAAHYVFASLFPALLLSTGCADHRQVYVWGPGESSYYLQWEHEGHRDHMEWGQRSDADRRAYWKWRKHHHE